MPMAADSDRVGHPHGYLAVSACALLPRGVELATLANMGRVHLATSIIAMLCVAPTCLSFGCGGAIEEEESPGTTGHQTTLAAPTTAPATTPYGSWDLVMLEGEKGKRDTEVHNHFYMELRADGKAIARRCTKTSYEPGSVTIRCADSQAYDCTYGTVKDDNGTWRVEFPDLEAVRADDRGEVATLPNGGLVVRHLLPSYAAGTFLPLPAESPTKACSGATK